MRLLSTIPTLFGLSILIFYTTTFFPPHMRAALLVSPFNMRGNWGAIIADPVPAIIEKYGLNDPWPIQYTRWLEVVLQGNLGWSYLYNIPVTEIILQSFPATLELVIYAAPIILIGGHKLGVYSAKRAISRASSEDPADFAVRSMTTIGYSIPSFCLGLLLLLIVFVGFGWVWIERLGAAADYFVHSPQWTYYTGLYTIDALLNGEHWIFFDALKRLLLPVITLTTQNLAIIVRITRSSMMGELVKPYVLTARAKGLDERAVINHPIRNSLASVLTVSGILFAGMLTGLIVTEYIFSIKGVGYLVVIAANKLDYPLLVGLSLVFCVIFMGVNLVVDIAYAYIDPRVKP